MDSGRRPACPTTSGRRAQRPGEASVSRLPSPLMATTRLAWGSSSSNISLKKKILIWSFSASSQARGKAKRDRGRVPGSQQGVQGQEPAPTCEMQAGATNRRGARSWLLGGQGGSGGDRRFQLRTPPFQGDGGSGRPPSSPTPPWPLWGNKAQSHLRSGERSSSLAQGT